MNRPLLVKQRHISLSSLWATDGASKEQGEQGEGSFLSLENLQVIVKERVGADYEGTM